MDILITLIGLGLFVYIVATARHREPRVMLKIKRMRQDKNAERAYYARLDK